MEAIQKLDWDILNWIRDNLRCGFLDAVMPIMSDLAKYGFIVILAAVVFMITRRYRACGVNIAIFLLVGFVLINLVLKPLIARERPCWGEEMQLLVAMPQDYSFPSGHTFHTGGTALIILFYDKRIGIPAMVLAVIISFSRMYLYVHYPSDVLGGALLGAVFAVGTYFLTRIIVRKLPMLFRNTEKKLR